MVVVLIIDIVGCLDGNKLHNSFQSEERYPTITTYVRTLMRIEPSTHSLQIQSFNQLHCKTP